MRSITNPRRHLLRLALAAAAPLAAASASDPPGLADSDRWAEAMAAFAQKDAEQPHPAGGIVFVGSSSIRFWDLANSFPKLTPPPLNRGFGGSEVGDSVRHFDRVIGRHRPRLVVFYAGDNDIAGGKSAEVVHHDFLRLVALLKKSLPDARLVYIAIKPSLARWNLADEVRTANRLVSDSCERDEALTFVDIWTPMLGDEGRPRAELFVDDGLHLNATGYALWSERLLPHLNATEDGGAED